MNQDMQQNASQMPEKEKKRMRQFSYVKIVLLLLFFISAIAFGSIAWFTMNKIGGVGGASVKVGDYPLLLEVHGDQAENKSLFSLVNAALFDPEDAGYQEGEQPDEDLLEFQATPGKNRIIWEKTSRTANDGHHAEGLEPNSCGKLTFWIVAKEAGTFDPEFEFQIDGFHAVTHDEARGNTTVTIVDQLFEINEDLSDHSDVDDSLTASAEAEKIRALEYVRSHILFFRDKDANGYYSGFLGNSRSFRLSDIYPASGGTTFTKGEKKQVTIYWKWANTFEQMIYDASYTEYEPILALASSDDRTALLTYLQPSNSSMFFGLTDAQVTAYLAAVQGNDEDAAEEAIEALSIAYNDADQEIGDMIQYILIEMTNIQ